MITLDNYSTFGNKYFNPFRFHEASSVKDFLDNKDNIEVSNALTSRILPWTLNRASIIFLNAQLYKVENERFMIQDTTGEYETSPLDFSLKYFAAELYLDPIFVKDGRYYIVTINYNQKNDSCFLTRAIKFGPKEHESKTMIFGKDIGALVNQNV